MGYESFWSPWQEISDVNQDSYQIAAGLKADHSKTSQYPHVKKIFLLDDLSLEGPQLDNSRTKPYRTLAF